VHGGTIVKNHHESAKSSHSVMFFKVKMPFYEANDRLYKKKTSQNLNTEAVHDEKPSRYSPFLLDHDDLTKPSGIAHTTQT